MKSLSRLLLFVLPALAGLSACQTLPYPEQPITPIRNLQNIHESWQQSHRFFIGFPTPEHFSVCHDLSCHQVSDLSLSAAEWQKVRILFYLPADSAEAERRQIKRAVALFETVVGHKAGTSEDLGQNTLQGSRAGQLDCIDEATNTSVYLRMLDTAGLLKWHRSAPRTSRGLFNGQAPHNTATLIEIETDTRYAVDAWFFANGQPPAITGVGAGGLHSWKTDV